MADANSTCVVADCDRPVKNKQRGLCDPHYKRVWRYGETQAHIPILEPRKRPKPVTDYADGTRLCQDCAQRLPLSCFHSDAKAPGGKRKTCKKCRVAIETGRYWRDPESAALKVKKFRSEHPKHVRERERGYYEKHKPARIDAAIAQVHRRRALMQGRTVEKGISVLALRKRDGDNCCYCGAEMVFASFRGQQRPDNQATLEHRLPIIRGGAHTWANVAIACWRCNITKGRKTEAEFIASSTRV